MTVVVIAAAVMVIAMVAIVIFSGKERELSGVLDEDGLYIKDPNRMFKSFVIFEAKRRAEYRCEYVTRWLRRRCPNTAENTVLHADHWIPWSKGGSSSEANIVILCSHCNLAKSAEVPFKWETERLYQSRLSYQINAIRPGHHFGSGVIEESWIDMLNPRRDVARYNDAVGSVVLDEELDDDVDADDFYRRYSRDNDD